MTKLTRAQANTVWTLLVKYCANEADWHSFMHYFCNDSPHGHEFRFRGIFGHGGKVRMDSYRGLWASYYSEDGTPELNKKMEELNASLQKMWNEFKSSP